jgi:uncharacterized protein (DUF302 family)
MSKYAFGKTVSLSFDQATEAVTQALAKEGFGVLTEIDVAATLKKKLGLERPHYKILGACNPQFARRPSRRSPRSARCCPAMWWCARTLTARRSSSSWTRTRSWGS